MIKTLNRTKTGEGIIIECLIDEPTLGTIIDLLGEMCQNDKEKLGMTKRQIALLDAFYCDASNRYWYIEGLGKH